MYVLVQVHMCIYIHYMTGYNTCRNVMELHKPYSTVYLLRLPYHSRLFWSLTVSVWLLPCCPCTWLCVEILLAVKACVLPVSFFPSCLSDTTCALSVCRFSLSHVQWLTDSAWLRNGAFYFLLKNLLSHLWICVYEVGIHAIAYVWKSG